MSGETHYLEYKDFSMDGALNKKRVMGILFKEIAAFANSAGGTVIVGVDDKTGSKNTQPDLLYSWLENDSLTSVINEISDNLIVFHSYREGDSVFIDVNVSDDAIMVGRATTGLNKGDCFIRENDKSIKANGRRLSTLVKKKAISTDNRLRQLRKIVHHKFATGENHANQMNVFDSLFVTMRSDKPYTNTVFDSLIENEFILGYRLPISKYSTIELHLAVAGSLLKGRKRPTNKAAFDNLMKTDHCWEMFFEAHRNEIVSSEQLKAYLLEYTHLFRTVS